MAVGDVAECAASPTALAEDTSDSHERVRSWCSFGAEEASMPPLRASVSHGEFADDLGLCSSACDSECGDGLAQRKN